MRSRAGRGLHLKIASGVIATIVVLAAADFLVDSYAYRRQVIEDVRESAEGLARTTLQAILEVAMLGEHPHLLQQAIERLVGEQPPAPIPVRSIQILDNLGVVHFSSLRANLGRRYDSDEEGCRQCHDRADGRATLPVSAFYSDRGTEVLRMAIPIPNRSECHPCHDPVSRANGLLLIDYSMENRWSQLHTHLVSMVVDTVLVSLVLMAVLGLLMNRLVISRVKLLTQAAMAFARDREPRDFGPLPGSDEVSALSTAFGTMATELSASMRESERQKGYLQGLMESIQYELVVVSPEAMVEMCNPAAEATWPGCLAPGRPLGETPLAVLGATVAETVESPQSLRVDRKLATAWGTRPYEVSLTPVRDGAAVVSRVILMFHDLTERQSLQRQVSRAERLASLGQLAAGVAHEINNPMAAISTCAEGLDRYLKAQARLSDEHLKEVSEYLSTIGEAALRCKDITQRLLSLSAEPAQIDLQRTPLSEVVSQVLVLIELEAKGRSITLRRDLDPRCAVLGDPKQLSQLVLNLLLNSLEATPPAGEVAVCVHFASEQVELEVRDNGCGIPEDALDRLFDPFFSANRQGRGTGLGLAICESIVRNHRGQIQIASKVEEGTHVRVRFPAMEPEP